MPVTFFTISGNAGVAGAVRIQEQPRALSLQTERGTTLLVA
jgi:hypothetical protein